MLDGHLSEELAKGLGEAREALGGWCLTHGRFPTTAALVVKAHTVLETSSTNRWIINCCWV